MVRGSAAILRAVAVSLPVLFLSPLSIAGAADEAVKLQPDNAAVVAQGEAIYRDQCAVCHGENLEGQPNWRQRNAEGRLPAPPQNASGHSWHHATSVLFTITKHGPAAHHGEGYESDMPAFEGVLSDEDIVAVLSFIKSTWPADIRKKHDHMSKHMKHSH